MKPATLFFFFFPIIILGVRGFQIDWINYDYVAGFSANKSTKSPTSDAQDTIMQLARQTAKNGPWSVTNGTIRPPSNNLHDYLSWAPYHWPDCNWCKPHPDLNFGPGNLYYPNFDTQSLHGPHRLRRVLRRAGYSEPASVDGPESANLPTTVTGPQVPLPTNLPDSDTTGSTPSHDETMTYGTTSPTDAPYEKTSASHSRTAKASRSACTPSPTTTMEPSATWTTCAYVTRDGQVNPDVRTLQGPAAINSASESIIYNAISQAFTGTSECDQVVAYFIDFFFLKPETKMNPNMNFGQMVRGPGPQGRIGDFAGILDMRGIVNVVNACKICMRLVSTPRINAVFDGYRNWLSLYAAWLRDSDIGKAAATRPNNHGTFYAAQLAAAKMMVGDTTGATDTVAKFFKDLFPEQLARSGEQPFEAVRTRPLHYRCFNLEALIAIAKIGDQLGMDFWRLQSKYGATIQHAVDYVMGVNPNGENVDSCFAHVAAAAAVYGDPDGRYAAFLQEHNRGYKSEPFYFNNQPEAVGQRRTKQQVRSAEEMLESIKFECPQVEGMEAIELDYGVFVTCQDLEPFYNL